MKPPPPGPHGVGLALNDGTKSQSARSKAIMSTTYTARFAAFFVATLLLLVPAIWNGFPLLFYDTGAYLGRYFFDSLSPGRSAVYGIFLGAARWPDFWPVVVAQSMVTVWTVALFLRAHGLGHRPIFLVALFALFTAATGLPWFAGQLMPDIFAGLAVLALYLVVFRAGALEAWERFALILLAAFAGATHNATLLVMALMLAAGIFVRLVRPHLVPALGLARTLASVALAVALLFAANFAVTGKIVWTPGGTAFAFSRLVHDGIVHRFLEDNCPNPRYELCKYRAELPHQANDFLWHEGAEGAFASIGGFEDGAAEMREIAIESLWQYPGLHLWTAAKATFDQLFAVGTGWGIVHDVWDAYGHIENLTPESVPAAHSARQRHNQLKFDGMNQLHVPVAWFSMGVLALFLLLAWRRRGFTHYGPMAATLSVALLANAFVCGVFSNPHDRYGARIVWIAVLFAAVALARALPVLRTRPVRPEPAPRTPVAAVSEPASLLPQPSYSRQKVKQD
jgi:hypothetical protein